MELDIQLRNIIHLHKWKLLLQIIKVLLVNKSKKLKSWF